MFVCLCGYAYMCPDVCRDQKITSNPPELELQVVVSYSMWMPDTIKFRQQILWTWRHLSRSNFLKIIIIKKKTNRKGARTELRETEAADKSSRKEKTGSNMINAIFHTN